MLQNKEDAEELNGQQTIDLIKEKIAFYKKQKEVEVQRSVPNPFAHITEQLQMIKGNTEISKEEIIDSYILGLQKEILQSFDKKKKGKKSSSSMSTSSKDDNQYAVLQDAQDPYEDDEDLDEDYNRATKELEAQENLQKALEIIKESMMKSVDNSGKDDTSPSKKG